MTARTTEWFADPANWHELAEIFPLMEGEDFDALVDDVRARGLDNPIVLLDDKVLDGRNRARACLQAGVGIEYEEYEDQPHRADQSPYDWVRGQNLKRRNLTKSQIAAAAARAFSSQSLSREQRRTVAGDFGISKGYIDEALALQRSRPTEFDKVFRGDRMLSEFMRDRSKGVRRKKFADVHDPGRIPQGQFQVIAADPPWPVAHAAEQYPTMPIDDICALGEQVQAAAAPNCILYLWAINLLLDEAFDVLRAWGFEYSGIITWNKTRSLADGGIEETDDQGRATLVRPTQKGQGAFYRNATEHILVGVRGSVRPPDAPFTTQFYAPIQGEHSKKPDDWFWPMVMRMTPGPYLEMFARRRWSGTLLDGSTGKVDAVWGNQAPDVDNAPRGRRTARTRGNTARSRGGGRPAGRGGKSAGRRR